MLLEKALPPAGGLAQPFHLGLQRRRQAGSVAADSVGAQGIAKLPRLLDARIVIDGPAPHGQRLDDARTEAADEHRILAHHLLERPLVHRPGAEVAAVLRMLRDRPVHPRQPATLDRRGQPVLSPLLQDAIAEIDVDHRPPPRRRPVGPGERGGDARETGDLEFAARIAEMAPVVAAGPQHPFDAAIGIAPEAGIHIVEIADPFHQADRGGPRLARVQNQRAGAQPVPVVEDHQHLEAVAAADEIAAAVALLLPQPCQRLQGAFASPPRVREVQKRHPQAAPPQQPGDGNGGDGVITLVRSEHHIPHPSRLLPRPPRFRLLMGGGQQGEMPGCPVLSLHPPFQKRGQLAPLPAPFAREMPPVPFQFRDRARPPAQIAKQDRVAPAEPLDPAKKRGGICEHAGGDGVAKALETPFRLQPRLP